MRQAAPDDDKLARYPHFHCAYIKASAKRAKQIAEDESVVEVEQGIPTTLDSLGSPIEAFGHEVVIQPFPKLLKLKANEFWRRTGERLEEVIERREQFQ